MPKLKPHLTVQQIAKKHNLDIEFVQKQLDMGEPIEHEHTKDHNLAMDIALQHLDEIPDYYTRLKKMEASAKKEHKKFKDVKEDADGIDDMDSPIHAIHAIHVDHEKRYCTKCKKVELRSECKYGPRCWDLFSSPAKLKEETMKKEERYCPLCDKRETRSECSYGGKAWDKVSVKDHEYSMARSELSTIADAVKRLNMKVGKGEGNLEAWVQSKITKAADYIDTVADYIASGEMDESLGFEIGAGHKKQQKIQKASEIATKGTTTGEKTAAKKAVQRLGGTAAELPSIKKEEKLVDKILDELEEGKGLWANIHARREKGLPRKKPGQKGYPKTLDIEEDLAQARKNVGASKCWPGKVAKGTKMKGGKEVPNCVSAESVTIEDANGNTFLEITDLIKPEPIKSEVSETYRLPSTNGNVILVTVMWRAGTYAIRMFFPQTKMPSRKDITDEIQKVYPGAKVLAYQVSDFQPGQALIIADKRSKNYLLGNKTIGEDIEIEEDWQSVNRKDKTDGLSQKAVNAYRRENPGSKLQTAVTEKNPSGKRASRRKSFCSRMSGMKKRLTSAETARDPDSRINKALRRWNCN